LVQSSWRLEESEIVPELMDKILEDYQLRERFKVALQFAELLENNPKAMEKLAQLMEKLGNQ